jgi:hypothetical protein
MKFTDLYPGFPGERVEVRDRRRPHRARGRGTWTTQVFGVGTLTDIYDVSPESLTLDLVGTPVRAFGAGVRRARGRGRRALLQVPHAQRDRVRRRRARRAARRRAAEDAAGRLRDAVGARAGARSGARKGGAGAAAGAAVGRSPLREHRRHRRTPARRTRSRRS